MHVLVGEEKSKGKLVDATHRKPFSRRRETVVRRPSYRRSQKRTAFNKSMQTQTATKQQNNFAKDSKLFGQMDRVNRQLRDFRYCFGLSTGFFRDPSSAETSNPIQPVQRGGRGDSAFGGGKISEDRGYRRDRTLQKSVSVEHFHNTQEEWREKAGGSHERPEQFHRTKSFQNRGSFAPAISPPKGGSYVQDRPKRSISNHSNCRKIKDLSKVSLEN